jgi:hypothetical protein
MMFRTVETNESATDDTQSSRGVNRRIVLLGGASALTVGALARVGLKEARAQESEATPTGEEGEQSSLKALREQLDEYGFLWSATSPATHSGDTYTLTATNPGTTAVKLLVFTIVMDHKQHHNEVVVNEEVELAAGASHEFTATNDYGTANHFSTRIASTAADVSALTLSITVTTADGAASASFNEHAFMIDNRDDLEQERVSRRAERKEARKHRRRRIGHGVIGGDEKEATPDADSTHDM